MNQEALIKRLQSSLEDVYVISDTHFLHDNIVKYCNRPKDHNQRMVKNWVEAVPDEATVIHLGDLVLGPRNKIECSEKFLPLALCLPGKKFLVKGNHDKKPNSWYRRHGFTVIDAFELSHLGRKVTFTHYPIIPMRRGELNVHGHTHANTPDGITMRHINVSVEVQDYTPQPLDFLLSFKHYQLTGEDPYGRHSVNSA